ALFAAAGVFHDGNGRFVRQAGFHQPRGDGGGDRAAHIDGDRGAGNRKPRPVGQDGPRKIVAGGEDERGGDPAQCQRQFEIGGGGKGGGDAGHDLIGDARLAEGRHFLAGAAIDQRI